MATVLNNREDIRAAFYSRLNTSADDDALAEGFASAEEHANEYVQLGIDSAQAWTIEVCDPLRWLARFNLADWQDDCIGTYHELPADFLRLSGDDRHSAIIRPNGSPWGRQLEDNRRRHQFRFEHAYYLANDRIYLIDKSPRPPTGSQCEYHHRLAVVETDADPIDFPLHDRWLIVAYACWHAVKDSWIPGAAEMESKVERDLEHWRQEVARRQRRSRQPRRMRTPAALGPNLLLGRRYG